MLVRVCSATGISDAPICAQPRSGRAQIGLKPPWSRHDPPALLGFFKALSDLEMPGISRVTSKLENLKKLESHLEHDNEATGCLRELLTDEAMKTICRKIYVRKGMIRRAARQRLRLGYISSCLLGFELGMATVPACLLCIHSPKDDNALFLALFVVLLIAGLTAAGGQWMHSHMALNHQFRLDAEGKTEASLLETMDESFARLEKYEKETFPFKLIGCIVCFLIAFTALAYTFIINNSTPVKSLNAIRMVAKPIYQLADIVLLVVSLVMLYRYPSENKNKKTEPMNENGQNDDSDDKNTRPSTGDQTGKHPHRNGRRASHHR